MIELKNREKKFIIIGIIIIAVSLAYARVFYPLYININALKKEYKEKQGIANDLAEIKSTVKLLEEKIDDDMKLLEKVEQNLPTGKNIHKLVVDLETFISKNHLRQHAFAPQDVEARETYYILPINIRVSGKFEDIIGFLKDWESYHRIINITETRMYPDEDNNIVGEFVANIYILKTEEGFVEDLDNHIFNGEKGRSDPFAPI
ncbi:MAG TPA: type 4a pilus biogenesis protein PilO [Thermoanaerobacterales bacterium]|nr:type 4a pilus biogenesis protein PilO [Thermoanaerobacterales bacterium]